MARFAGNPHAACYSDRCPAPHSRPRHHRLALETAAVCIMDREVAVTDSEKRAVPVQVKEHVKHTLSREQQVYYDKIVDAIVSDDETTRVAALRSLESDTGLAPLLPYFTQFICEKITINLRNLPYLRSIVRMIKALLCNGALFLEPYVRCCAPLRAARAQSAPLPPLTRPRRAADAKLHQLIPAVLTCLLSKSVCQHAAEDHWSLRDFSATLLRIICDREGPLHSMLQARISKTLFRAFMDRQKWLTTHYGAVKVCPSLATRCAPTAHRRRASRHRG